MIDEPDMSIVNQINAALQDIRSTLVYISGTVDGADIEISRYKAMYQLNLAFIMINEHGRGVSVPWSDRKHIVDEEFS